MQQSTEYLKTAMDSLAVVTTGENSVEFTALERRALQDAQKVLEQVGASVAVRRFAAELALEKTNRCAVCGEPCYTPGVIGVVMHSECLKRAMQGAVVAPEVKCPECEGCGHRGGFGSLKCSLCGGTGKAPTEAPPMRNSTTTIYPGQDENACQTCLKCHGTGREVTIQNEHPFVYYGDRCTDCFGDEDDEGGCWCGLNCERDENTTCPMEEIKWQD